MQTFNDSEFSLLGNDGIRMFFDMKGSGSLCFKVTDRQAHDLFCREMGIRPDDSVSPDFAMEFFFTGVSWFSMDKMPGRGAIGRTLSCEASSESACKKDIRINFSTSGGASICLRIKYDQVESKRVSNCKFHAKFSGIV